MDNDDSFKISPGATVGGIVPTYTTDSSYSIDIKSFDDDHATISYDPSTLTDPGFTYSFTDTEAQFDQQLIDSNPTLKKLWEQFNYVYSIVEADRDNEVQK